MSKIINPFIIGSPIIDNKFYCPRKEDSLLKNKLETGTNNIYIAEERRIGKTSLIKKTVAQSKHLLGFYIDISISSNLSELIRQMLTIDNSISLSPLQREKISQLKTNFLMSPVRSEQDLKEFLGQALKAMTETRTKEKSPVLILDEFQEINKFGDIKVKNILRSSIQIFSDLRVIFTGSIRNSMEALFENRTEIFYNSAQRFLLGLIPEADFYEFANAKLGIYGWKIKKNTFSKIYKITYGITEDVQRVLAKMFDQSRIGNVKVLDDELLETTIRQILNEYSNMFEKDFESLTNTQKTVVGIISKHDNIPLYKVIDFSLTIRRTQFIKETLNDLVKKGIISEYNSRGVYKFYNPFFKTWIAEKLKYMGLNTVRLGS